LELKSECTWVRVGDGAALQTSLGLLGGGSVGEERPSVMNALFVSKMSG
jgi:H+/Cl- antiporter ClcA